jgi:hypothetical protein
MSTGQIAYMDNDNKLLTLRHNIGIHVFLYCANAIGLYHRFTGALQFDLRIKVEYLVLCSLLYYYRPLGLCLCASH